ncbi:membrane protein insertase YidC [Chelatococcus reniformis]|uniref:Membrane protein insertase YidC n=1 Tax=Chelatococcus reniformis TaxID=1494448 RepID=A0A916XK55_9HYPH|nr:membrane protein insertase YidC [Chelatococcus reniformis]GGC80185.1 membrane protein insertase YidC [Chelatococcus reniformis]
MTDNRNLIFAIALSMAVLLGWQYFFAPPPPPPPSHQPPNGQQTTAQTGQQPPGAPGQPAPGGLPQAPGMPAAESREAALKRSPRVVIDTPRIAGSVALQGARIDDVSLKAFRETVDPKSPIIVLLSPVGAPEPYYADFGWIAAAGANTALPSATTEWKPASDRLTVDKPLTLTWDNGQGLVFTRVISVDDNAMFTVKQSVSNTGGQPVTLYPFALVARWGKPATLGYFVLHEGPLGVLGAEGLQEPTYDKLLKDPILYGNVKGRAFSNTVGGWVGITDKYWATAVVPDQDKPFEGRFTVTSTPTPIFQTDVRADAVTVAPGATASAQTRLFAGAKEVDALNRYQETLGILKFDLLIDWGWFHFITKPLFRLLDLIFRFTGNFGVAILLVTVLVKLVFFPLANRSYASMAKMKAVQPEIMAIRERYTGDSVKQQQATMELYKREKINPIAGCLPMLIQIPVFFALYKVLLITIEMRHAPFFGWIRDLAAPDPTNLFTLFGLIPWTPPTMLHLGIWPIIMGITMFLQMKMNPEPPDPIQKAMFSWMPVIFTFTLGSFPAGLVIYWSWNNFLGVLQQYFIMRRQGVKVELWDNLFGLFRRKAQAAKPTS